MRTITCTAFVTLDGVTEAPDQFSFPFQSEDTGAYNLAVLRPAETLLLGRETYEGFAAAWPGVTDEEGYAEKFNAMEKVVVAPHGVEASWNNTTVLGDADVVGALRALKEGPGGEILVWGSPTLCRTLLAEGLVDAYELLLCPVVAGGGKSPFADDRARHALKTVKVTHLSGGMIALRLERS